MRRVLAAALVLVTAALLLVPAVTAAMPAPGKLWSEFPLEPVTATTPTGPTPAQVGQPTRPQRSAPSEADGPGTWIFVLLGAVAVGGIELLTRNRRSGGRQQPGAESERKPDLAVLHTFERVAPDRASGSLLVAGPTTTGTAAQATLIEALSPQARLAEEHDGRESEADPETHQVCEIECWRGYVTWQFYVESELPLQKPFSSAYFRAPGQDAPHQSDAALEAYAGLVEALVADGWEPEGYGEEWFSERFQRPIPLTES